MASASSPHLLDSSAIVAIILQEPGWQLLRDRINQASGLSVSAVTLLETHLVLTSKTGIDSLAIIEAFISEIGAEVLPFTALHWREAAQAFLRYGKGRAPAALNFGDCISYATARASGLPLLFKGDDFSRTDLGS